MLIIVEGVDGVGKTTFVSDLSDKIRELIPGDELLVHHAGPPTSPPLEEYELALQDYRPGDGRHIVCDRWHLGNLVYGPLLRQETTDPIQEYHIEKFLRSRGAVVVGMVAPEDLIAKRRSGRDQPDLIGDHQVGHVQQSYLNVLWDSELPVQLINNVMDRESEEYQKQVLESMLAARAAELEVVDLTAYRSYVGGCHPQVLLLGERKNPNGDPRWEGAFVPGGGTAGRYLIGCLTPDLKKISGFANALEENVEALYNVLGKPAVVALGKEAKQTLAKADIPHGSVPHPQYVRRFHHGSGCEYGQAIRRAAIMQEDLIQWRP